MRQLDPQESFRMSAILYADRNYNLSPRTVLRKVIESAFLQVGNEEMSAFELIKHCNDHYSIIISLEELRELVNRRSEHFLTTDITRDHFMLRLTDSRHEHLQDKVAESSIDSFIEKFSEHLNGFPLSRVKDTVYRYLYSLFVGSTYDFGKLLNLTPTEISDVGRREIEDNFNSDDVEIIRQFLDWENDGKDEAIFNLANYALEYCFLTNSEKNRPSSDNLFNKTFYLDTNIIFRLIGINGEQRKYLTETFIGKCRDLGINILISRFSDREFRDYLDGRIDEIRKFNLDRLKIDRPHLQSDDDIFSFYYEWARNRRNKNASLFKDYLLSLYDSAVQRYGIEKDSKCRQINTDGRYEDQIKEYSGLIGSFKQKKNRNTYHSSIRRDAMNVLLVDEAREGRNHNVVETKYFLVSTDQVLRRWDFQRSKGVPVVLLPSQWMALMLRYASRTTDDVKSFISFINLRQTEQIVSNEDLHIVLSGISEIAEDIEQQRLVVDTLLEDRFQTVLEGSSNPEEIHQRSKEYAESKLSEELSEARRLAEEKANSAKEKEQVARKANQKAQDAEARYSDLESDYIQSEIQRIRIIGWLWLAASLVTCIPIFLVFVFQDWEYNYIAQAIAWAESKSGLKETILNAIALSYLYLPYLVVKNLAWPCLSIDEDTIREDD